MINTTMTNSSAAVSTHGLEIRWVETTDHRGRSVMEARWVVPGEAIAAAHAA